MNFFGKYIIIILLFSLGCNSKKKDNSSETNQLLQTVNYVDLERFMGDWYIIANIPTFIEKRATNAIESYKLNERGEIETRFTFYQDNPNGKKKEYSPTGYIYNKSTNAEWRMQFLWPFKMPFLIIDLDSDYTYTVIGYPDRSFVWIMSREPSMDIEVYDKVLYNLFSVGYDTTKIQKVLQDWN